MDFNVSIGLFLMYVVLYYENCLIRLQVSQMEGF